MKGQKPRAAGSSAGADRSAEVSWRHMAGAFRVPEFAWYWASQLLSGMGTWSQAIAQAWLVMELSRSQSRAAVWLGTITMLQFLPLLIFAPFGGVVADRVSRRRLLVVTQSAASLQALLLAVLVYAGSARLWQVGILAFLLGTTNAFNNPAQQAFIPELVGRPLVADAVALNSVQFNSARMIGGAVGGIAVAAWGISGALVMNAASFIPAILVLALIRPAHTLKRAQDKGEAVFAQLRTGFSYAISTAAVRRVVLLFGVASLVGLNWQVVLPLVARYIVHRQVTGFGTLMAAFGVGALIAAILLARDQRVSEQRLVIGGVALGFSLILLGWSHWYLLSLLVVAGGGAASIVVSVTANTRLQLLVPDNLRGRVMGIYVLLMGGTTPIGSYLLGQVSGGLGPAVGILAFGVATVVAVVAISLGHRRSGPVGHP
ncbi:MAG: MFS transporter [Actinomycetota bacterium]|nr:MFS transporter [Actinomycetota bacterium]